jgi:activating signal cointegrator 1
MKQMRLISVHEPWATLMALGLKRIETRNWATSYRGPLAIHASKHGMSNQELWSTLENPFFRDALRTVMPTAIRLMAAGRTRRLEAHLAEQFVHRGKILCVVDLKDCKRTEDIRVTPAMLSEQEYMFGNYEPMRFGWLTEMIFRLPEPVAFSSRQGLVDVPAELRQELVRQWRDRRAA